MALPIFKDDHQPFQLMQSKWAGELNPILAVPLLSGHQLKGISLVASTPQAINTLLGRKQQGYLITNQDANAVIWRTQDLNSLTLTLESSANVTLDLWVY